MLLLIVSGLRPTLIFAFMLRIGKDDRPEKQKKKGGAGDAESFHCAVSL
jgi:hypothetical protein